MQSVDAGPSEAGEALFVVGIGASAGGLEAIERFFRAMPPEAGLTFILVQHLSPDFKSFMGELLGRYTRMRVEKVHDDTVLEPDTVLILPPGKEILLQKGSVRLQDLPPRPSSYQPITAFFRGLARTWGERSAAVVLSGAGTDGSLGVGDVRDAGGLVLVQDERTARFESMPRSSAATGFADHVVAPEDMPALLLDHVRQLAEAPAVRGGALTSRLFERLLEAYAVDFTSYKQSTVARRVARRAATLGLPGVDAYVTRALGDGVELEALFQDLVIGVTEFFRDRDAFDVLQTDAVDGLVRETPPDQDLRLWVPGCSTGEEAYSLTILALAALERAGREPNLKVFATDVNRRALQIAAEGLYPRASVEGLPPAIVEKHFLPEGPDHVRVAPAVRRAVLFTAHNLLRDAPFTRIDLVSCRNLLIYLDGPAQARVLATCHFALRKGGVLFLGPSESVGALDADLEPIATERRIYRKRTERRLLAGHSGLPTYTSVRGTLAVWTAAPAPADLRLGRAYDELLARFAPTGVLVDEERQIVHSFGEAHRYLRPLHGRATLDVTQLVLPELRPAVVSALTLAAREQRRAVCSPVTVPVAHANVVLVVAAEPLKERRSGALYLLTLAPEGAEAPPAPAADGVRVDEQLQGRLEVLEAELEQTRHSLRQTVELLEAANEELHSTNEELHSANEELQATNEELHSVNEELYSVNQEHEKKITELDEVATNLRHLIRETDVGMIFTDRLGCVRLFTPVAARLFNLLPQDVGRPLAHITSRVPADDVLDVVSRVRASDLPEEARVVGPDGRVYLRRVKGYRDPAHAVGGVLLAFVDVTDLDGAEAAVRRLNRELERRVQALADREHLLATVVEGLPDGLLVVDEVGAVVLSNARVAEIFGVEPGEVKDLASLLPAEVGGSHPAWVAGYLRDGVAQRMAAGRVVAALRRDGAPIDLEVGLAPVQLQGKRRALARVTDVTHRLRAEAALRRSESRFRRMFRNVALGQALLDAEGCVLEANAALCAWLGHPEPALRGRPLLELVAPGDRPLLARGGPGSAVAHREVRLVRAGGVIGWARVSVVALGEGDGAEEGGAHAVALVEDMDALHTAREEQRDVEHKLQEAAKLESLGVLAGGVAHDFNNIVAVILGNAEHARGLTTHPEPAACLDDIVAASRRAAGICAQLLAYSGRSRFVISDTDLSWLVADTLKLVGMASGHVRVDATGLGTDLPPVRVDRSQLQQVVMNLAINAIEAIGSGAGNVRLRTARAAPDRVPEGHGEVPWVELEVADDGVGIPPEALPRIFEPFFTTKVTGRGLGLAAVQGIVKAHHGVLDVESEVGAGTTFRLLLPAVDAPPPEDSGPSVRARRPGTATVLVVDDEPAVRRMLERILASHGYHVAAVGDGEEAVARVERASAPFDVVLLDLTMPGLDGTQVFHRLRSVRPGLRVILMSGYAEAQATRDLDGLAGFLKKPIGRDELFAAVESAIRADRDPTAT